ncbi:MAG: hypothetical protein C7B46_17120 [Sulfobacillus benefaciens]|uniref:Prepilin type IV endopeptidase peptidase domain-containing protein n=1 Tax=Sulfobacillus benefaciens TaxID=453960 RepID=A0A2T2X9T1_9FIRM|nr:MAG: hypothetical protein C7B46_17120 [Sulfobacillus benefaciens]
MGHLLSSLSRTTLPGYGWVTFLGLLGIGSVVAGIDWQTRRIPNRWMIGGAVGFLIWQGVAGNLWEALWGGLLAVSLSLTVRAITRGLGMGDVKYFGVVGLALGPLGVLAAMGITSGGAVIEGLVRVLWQRGALSEPRPLGPWIAVGSVLVALVFVVR